MAAIASPLAVPEEEAEEAATEEEAVATTASCSRL